MKRRTFLKILGGTSIMGIAPILVAKEELKPSYHGINLEFTVNGKKVEPMQEYQIVAKDIIPVVDYKPIEIANDRFLDNWAYVYDIQRIPFETDWHLRNRILDKIRN